MSNSRYPAPARWLRYSSMVAAGAVCLLLFGCASAPMSADAAFGGGLTPAEAIPLPGPASSRDGIYAGTAEAMVNGNFTCPPTMSITGFRVAANVVWFGGFDGTIADDGSVLIPFKGMWLSGRFEGPRFLGRVNALGSASQFITCVHAIAVTRLAA